MGLSGISQVVSNQRKFSIEGAPSRSSVKTSNQHLLTQLKKLRNSDLLKAPKKFISLSQLTIIPRDIYSCLPLKIWKKYNVIIFALFAGNIEVFMCATMVLGLNDYTYTYLYIYKIHCLHSYFVFTRTFFCSETYTLFRMEKAKLKVLTLCEV